MNTVDSLKKLYKTMAGKDWPYDPNPTDAEVIDKIAADASGSGSGGGGSQIRIVSHDGGNTFDPIEPGLTAEELSDAKLIGYGENGEYNVATGAVARNSEEYIMIAFGVSGTPAYYIKSTGEITVTPPGTNNSPIDSGGVIWN